MVGMWRRGPRTAWPGVWAISVTRAGSPGNAVPLEACGPNSINQRAARAGLAGSALCIAGLNRGVTAKRLTERPEHKEATVRPSPSGTSTMAELAARFVLPWSAYVRLLAVKGRQARQFYEAEAVLRFTGLEITNLLYCDHAVAH